MFANTIVEAKGDLVCANLLEILEARLRELVECRANGNGIFQPSDATFAALYHLNSGGKRTRGRIALHAGLVLGLSQHNALCLASSAEILHNASLIHDDLQDRDESRHGQLAVWVKFGVNIAICAGDLMISAAYAALCGISGVKSTTELMLLTHGCTAEAVHGQCQDLSFQNTNARDAQDYKKIVIAKSGALLSLPLQLALVASGHSSSVAQARQASEAFSVAYQIADDLIDASSDSQKGALNAVSFIGDDRDPAGSVVRACQLGLRHLDDADLAARGLPCNSGAVLVQMSCELREFFRRRA